MKIAYLMNGLIGGTVGRNSNCLDNTNVKSQIIKHASSTHSHLKNADIDYFIFSWEPELEATYTKCYAPKQIKVVPQRAFNLPDHFRHEQSNPRIQGHYSRWYGFLNVFQMCHEYSCATDTKYDLIISARLDLCYQRNIDLSLFNQEQFHISNPQNIPGYNWPNNIEIIDHIFASNMENMRKFSCLYLHLNEYTRPNECPSWKLISHHFLSVWHLGKIGLLDKKIIKESFTTINEGHNPDVDYYIFRYKK